MSKVTNERNSNPDVFCKTVFLETSQNSQENTCTRDSGTGVHLLLQNTCGGCSWNETEDKEDEVKCLRDSKESEKQMKSPVRGQKTEKETKEIMEVLYNFHNLHAMVKYEKFHERS